ncbi:hypothetical protein E2C01_082461 [Portunus trituberculatus]|uniref:Uncharacterized protein n=1 Tax=Portunus trituberculatus TaxID=210409 RepID=A0A5B7IYJ7_PORTR|nr:hypothetical protein [Portunus trituberculatus]
MLVVVVVVEAEYFAIQVPAEDQGACKQRFTGSISHPAGERKTGSSTPNDGTGRGRALLSAATTSPPPRCPVVITAFRIDSKTTY